MYQPVTLRKPPLDTDKPLVKQLIEQGKSDSQIAKHFNVTKDTIYARRKRWGFAPATSKMKDQQRVEDITALWKKGLTVKEIAYVLGLTTQTVYNKIKKYKITATSRMGIEGKSVSLTNLRTEIANNNIDEDSVVLITHNRVPKWALVPIDTYTYDLVGKSDE